jgi:hypothetical protein
VARLNIDQRLHFWIVFAKDIVSLSCNVIIHVAIIVGILNRCSCWTHGGKTGLILGNIEEVYNVVSQRSKRVYPAIIFFVISMHLIYCGLVAWWYRHALRVYLQRDYDRLNSRTRPSASGPVEQWPLAGWRSGSSESWRGREGI